MLVECMDFVVRPWPSRICPVLGAVRVDSDGRANIYINPNVPKNAQESALKHELRHYELNHPWQYDKPAEVCEAEVRAEPRLRSAVYDRNGDRLLEGSTWQD